MEYVAGAMAFAELAGGLWGSNKQKNIDKNKVKLTFADNMEKIRRREFTQEATLGKTKAMSENSGVRHTGGSTAQGYIDTMAQEFKKELDWMKKYASTARDLGLDAANLDYQTNNLNAFTGAISTGASAFS